MKETGFIKQNIDKWQDYETELKKPQKDPAKISKLYVQVTDDLSFAQTYYNTRSVRVYLNGIVQLLFNDINRTEKLKFKSLIDFWKIDLPVTMFKIRYELMFSLLIFTVMVGIGIITSVHEPEFARTVLGDEYVDMTIENISKNDPMAVYKSYNSIDMFLGITINNLKVAFITFILGLFFGFGTFFSLMQNGIMLGTFQYFFIERDLFRESFLTIWQHGTLEISAIVIAGAAGFTIGRGLLFPGTFTRFQSLRITARRGLKVMIGLIPVFVFAAFIEGFFTRVTDAPDVLRIISIILSLFFVLFYFVFYPWKVATKYPEKLEIAEKVLPGDSELPPLDEILPDDKLFGGTLKIIKVNFGKLLRTILLSAVILAAMASLFSSELLNSSDEGLINQKRLFGLFIDYKTNTLLFLMHSLMTGMVLFTAFSVFSRAIKPDYYLSGKNLPKRGQILINTLIVSLLFNCIFFLPGIWAVLLTIIFLPFLLLGYYISCLQNKFLFEGISQGFALLQNTFGMFLLHNLKFLIICILILLLASPGIYTRVLMFLKWNLWIEEQYVVMILDFILSLIFYGSVLTCMIMLAVANNLFFHSLWEIQTGKNLLGSIDKIGTKKYIRGYEFE